MKKFGTSFKELEDEQGPVKKRPKRIHEEVVTDERGRRRFHGAFTGGFSAGYFNTVGSKHGWVPQEYKSSRDNRAAKSAFQPEDFMDEEDLGEFGIASRNFHVNRMYMDAGKPEGTAVWDRPSTTTAVLDDFFKVSSKTESNSIGMKIMKAMGYREGKGIGAPLTRRQLEIQRHHEARAQGKKSRFDQSAVEEAEEFAQGIEFIPEDIPPVYFKCKENDHGLGYVPLKGLSGGYQSAPSEGRSKRGDAFGVGVFEDSDDDIYGNDDMNQYNFALTGKEGMKAITSGKASTIYDIKFVRAFKPKKRTPHLTITVPPGFRGTHVPIPFDISKLPSSITAYGSMMTPLQRAMILGEKDASVMELLSHEDREKLRQARRLAEDSKKQKPAEPTREKSPEDPFIEDEEKSYRFKKYLQCLKRGVTCGKPAGLTSPQWAYEEIEFQNAVPNDMRYLLPDVQARKQPLYKGDFAKTVMQQMKSIFVSKDDNTEIAQKPTPVDSFEKVQWYPAKRLCRRLKVPDPFPNSEFEGVLGGKNRNKVVKGTYEFTKTAAEEELSRRKPTKPKDEPVAEAAPTAATDEPDPLCDFFDLMDKVYGTSTEEIKEGEKLESRFSQPKPKPKPLSPVPVVAEKTKSSKPTVTMFDQDDDANVYGPKPPIPMATSNPIAPTSIEDPDYQASTDVEWIEPSSTKSDPKKKKKKKKHRDSTSQSDSSDDERRHRRKEKKRKKESKHRKHDSENGDKESRRHRDSSSKHKKKKHRRRSDS